MRKTALAFLGSLFVVVISAQGQRRVNDGMRFTMRAENNLLYSSTQYNLTGKSEIEKLLFGKVNAKVEFFVAPSFEGSYGFRLVNDSIEVKDIPNRNAVRSEMSKEYPTFRPTLPKSVRDSIQDVVRYDNEMLQRQREEAFKLYEVRTRSFHISDALAEKIYEKFVSSINNFEPGGVPPIIKDGEFVTFRCVVGDKVQALTVHEPIRETGKLSDTCKQLIKDLTNNKMDEAKYIELFE